MAISARRINLDKLGIEEQFYKSLKLAIQKIGSSNKTKVLHKMIDEKILYLGFGVVDVTSISATRYGTIHCSGDKLSGLMVDLKYALSSSDRSTIGSKIDKMNKINKEKLRISTTITDTSSIQLNTLEKEMKGLVNDLLDSINYFDLVDIYYALFLEVLTKKAFKDKGKNKLFEAAHSLFLEMIKSLLKEYKLSDDDDATKRLEICTDYIFASLFTEANGNSIISNLKRMYSEEDVQFLVDLKPSKLKKFGDIATLLTQAHIINSTPNSFVNAIKVKFGATLESSINTDLESFISTAISAKYKSSVFDLKVIDEEKQNKLETLLLNYKSKIIIKR